MASGWDASLVDAFTWVSKNDYKRAQEKAYGFSSTVAAIKGDVNFLKAEIAGLAVFSAGAGLVKFDYTLFKVDEKGVSWKGRQIYATKTADDVKHFQTKLDKTNRDFYKAVTALDDARKEQQRKLTNLQAANDRVAAARAMPSSPDRVSELSRTGGERHKAQQEFNAAKKEYDALKTRVGTLTQRVETLRADLRKVKPDEQFKKAVDELKKFEQAMAEAAEKAAE